MIIITADNLLPLDEFRLKWRFTDKQYNLLHQEAQQQIHPLTADCIHEIRKRVHFSSGPNQDPQWRVTGSFDASTDRDLVVRWLRSQVPNESTNVVVFWWSKDAVLTTWDIFCSYWSDFCYPSSDDIAILPLDEQWVITYHHEEVFEVLHPES